MIIKRQKQVSIRDTTKLATKAHLFDLKMGLNGTNKQRKYNKEFVNTSFSSKLINGGVLLSSGGWEIVKN